MNNYTNVIKVPLEVSNYKALVSVVKKGRKWANPPSTAASGQSNHPAYSSATGQKQDYFQKLQFNVLQAEIFLGKEVNNITVQQKPGQWASH